MTEMVEKTHASLSMRGLSRWSELGSLLFLVAVVMPALTVGAVGGYGFAVWTAQQIYGPPGPSGH
jgi:nitrate reductase NapE component